MISVHRLRCLLDYEPQNGAFVWRERTRSEFQSERAWKTFNNRYAGNFAGALKAHGYVCIHIDYKFIYAHRLAWLYMTGEWPEGQIDHIDGNRQNNSFANLRNVSAIQNSRNTAKPKNNKSGVIGVHQEPRYNRWVAQIRVNYKIVHLGQFAHKEEAVFARRLAEEKFGFHRNHGRDRLTEAQTEGAVA